MLGEVNASPINIIADLLMCSAMNQLRLSACACHRILQPARTIADLAASEQIQPADMAEVLQYRPRMMESV